MEYVIAKYIRLSLEDAKTESMSIENQRILLDNYIETMNIENARIVEVVDNGYTGTSYERPGVQELIELVRAGNVNCILVKDFSRLGRNAVESGYFLQIILPLFRARFVAVSEGYDSDDHIGDTGGLDVSFRLLIHEQYSRDLSRKVKASKAEKARRGEMIVKNCAFGYKKVGSRLEIDEPAAETVRLLFNMYSSGMNLADIGERLYSEKRPTPKEYRKTGGIPPVGGYSCFWDKACILAVLHNEQYIGTYTAGKSRSIEVGSGKNKRVDESQWVKIPNHHPAIVNPDEFKAVQGRVGTRPEALNKRELGTWERYRHITSPLKGKVVCGCCNHHLRPSYTINMSFHCRYTYAAPDMPCYRFKITGNDLSTLLLDAIRKQIKECSIRKVLEGSSNKPALSETELLRLSNNAQKSKQTLYESLVRKEIGLEEFKAAKAPYDAEIERLNLAHVALKAEKERAHSVRATDLQMRELSEVVAMEDALSQKIVDMLIEKVYVHPDGKVIAEWKAPGFNSVIREGR